MDKTKKEFKTFSEFTNLYSLSKTLRFELKPVGNTQKMLEEAQVFKKDEIIQKKYEKTKPYFDRLHREFVDEALSGAVLTGLDEYFKILKIWQKDKKNKEAQKAYESKLQELRRAVVNKFDNKAEKWVNEIYTSVGLKNKNIEILFEEAIFDLLKTRYGEDPKSIIKVEENDKDGGSIIKQISIFDSWKGFTGYFKKLFETRRNFYKDDGTSTALATRIIDQNLKRFCDNLQVFENVKDKIDKNDSEDVEKDFNVSLAEVFSLEFYNRCLLQNGIDFYNKILGGETMENGKKKKGINELINKYRQDHKSEKLPFLKKLDKQILSEKANFLDEVKNEAELLEVLKKFHQTAEDKTTLLKKLFTDFVGKNEEYDLSQIYLSKEALNTIAHRWTGETETLEKRLYEAMKVDKLAKYEKKENVYKFSDFIALSYIKIALENREFEGNFWKEKYYNITGFAKKTNWEQFLSIFSFEFNSLFARTVKDEMGNEKKIGYDIFLKDFETLIKKEPFALSQEVKVVIKEYADSVLNIYQIAKYFAVEKKRAWLAKYELDSFYTHPETGYLKFYENAYEDIVQVYNDLRNFLTKKPYSEEKWKLNFENPTLANGWDKNKESDNSAVILRKGKKYFLGLMAKGKNKIFNDCFKENFKEKIEKGKYEKVVYKFFPDQAKMFPKVCFSDKGLKFFKPSEEILHIYKKGEFKKGDTFSVASMQRFIDFYKDCLTKYEGWQGYNFIHLKPTISYQKNIGEFFRDIAEDGYKIDFKDISEHYINEKNKNKELYLFEIHNKDWNEGVKGSKNLHTLYFESLFSTENIANNFPMKLNGQAEIFYRPKTEKLEKEKIITKEKKITLEKGNKAFHKNRYTENKIFFHVPLTLNRTKSDPYQFNTKVNNFLASNPDINVIGVDRGEKHLAYYSVINQKQEILESGSLNEITGVNYAEKLEGKAKNREQARKDWQMVEGIKNLKKGYISQVVRKMADLAIKHNAIIVFEDLNMRFKQIRGGIEKSAYQQLEKALIEKLNFLVQKGETDPKKAGHLLRAYQLTAPFEAFKDMGKQTGIIFYTQAAYTSRIDPITGWRPHLYLKYSSAKIDILKFTKIEFINGRFEFTYDIKNFRQDKEYPKNTVWTICSNVERFRWDKSLNQNNGGYTHYTNLTDGKTENKNSKSTKSDNFKELFVKYSIDISKDIQEQIKNLETKGNEKFFEHFIFFFNLICQIRNTQKEKNGDDNDFILSPVEPFFDSRKTEQFGKNLPKNGDDNGAYNIARKGIIILQKISQLHKEKGGCEKMTWGDLYVSGTDWDDFTHNNQAT